MSQRPAILIMCGPPLSKAFEHCFYHQSRLPPIFFFVGRTGCCCTEEIHNMCPLHCRCLLSSSGSKAESAVTLWHRSDTSGFCRSQKIAKQIERHLRRSANLLTKYTDTRQQATIFSLASCPLINMQAWPCFMVQFMSLASFLQVIQTYPPDPAVKWGDARSLGGAVVLMTLMIFFSAEISLEGRPGSMRQLVAMLFDVDVATSEDFWPKLPIEKEQGKVKTLPFCVVQVQVEWSKESVSYKCMGLRQGTKISCKRNSESK